MSLSDKLDALTVFFYLGIRPTSSSDPFALRRAALGVVRILVEHALNLDLRAAVHEASVRVEKNVSAPHQTKMKEIENEILQFLIVRAKAYFLEKGYGKECVDAIFCGSVEDGNLYDSSQRLYALFELKNSRERMGKFSEVMKRCLGQLEGVSAPPLRDGNELRETSEKQLFKAIQEVEIAFSESERSRNWQEALNHIVHLQKPIDDLFTELKILSDDMNERNRRLGLLQAALHVMNRFGDMRRFLGYK